MKYSKKSVLLAQELSATATANLVNKFGYTVWSDVATHKVHTERPVNYEQRGYYCSKDHSQGYMQSANLHWHPDALRVEVPRRNFWQWVRSIWKLGR